MTDFIDYENIAKQTPFIIQICVALLTIFLTIFYTLLLTLMSKADDIKFKILSKGRNLCTKQEKAYTNIGVFVKMSAEYFHLMAVFLIFQILKIFTDIILNETYLIWLNFSYLCYFAWYFKETEKKSILSKLEKAQILGLFYLLPYVMWFITYQQALSLDLILSFGVLICFLTAWFCFYPVCYSPFFNLKKLQKRDVA